MSASGSGSCRRRNPCRAGRRAAPARSPTGRSRWPVISATDITDWQSRMMARCSGPRPIAPSGSRADGHHQRDEVELARVGSVRPLVITYGRTIGPRVDRRAAARPPAARLAVILRSLRSPSRPLRRGRGEVLPHAGDEHRHLVGDEAHVGVLAGEHGEAGALAGHVTSRNADFISMIVCRTGPPPKRSPAPLARLWMPGGDRGRGARRRPGSSPRDAISRPSADSTTALRRLRHPLDQVVQQPAQIRTRTGLLRH